MVDETQPDFLQIDEDEDSGVSNFTAFDLLQQPSKFKEELEKQYKVEDDLIEQSKQNYVDKFNSTQKRIFNKITFKNFVSNFFSAYAG